MENNLVIAQALNGAVRIHIANTTELVRAAKQAHDLWPTSCAALGRVLTVNALMASDLKNPDEKITITIDGKGPAGMIVSQGNGKGEVKGFIDNPFINLTNPETNKLDVGKAVGRNGNLTVAKNLGLKEPFTGVVPLQSGEIGEDFATYFAYSEQVPSVVSVGVYVVEDSSVDVAGGMFLQLMPNAKEEDIRYVEMVSQTMYSMTDYLRAGRSCIEIIQELFPDVEILEERTTKWYCDCSKEHFTEVLTLLDQKDLNEMIREDHGAEVVCQYCGKKYWFSEDELKDIVEKHIHVEHRKHLDS